MEKSRDRNRDKLSFLSKEDGYEPSSIATDDRENINPSVEKQQEMRTESLSIILHELRFPHEP